MKIIKDTQNFQWIGEGISSQSKKNRIHYEAFISGDLKIATGDFVLVRNDDALDPEDFMSCYVAQVKKLFETGHELDPYKAQVQWFSRALELPTYAILSFKNGCYDLEIVKDTRSSWHNIIDAETIFQKCEVLFFPSGCEFESTFSEYKNHSGHTTPVFFCRYVFTGTHLFEVKDNPAKPSLTNGNCGINGFSSHSEATTISDTTYGKGRSPNKVHEKYCAISVGSPSKIPRVVIKRIDDKILESKNKNIRIFVADSSIDNVEDVADIFLNKLKLEKQEVFGTLEKKPVIHSFTSQEDNSERDLPTTDSEFIDCNSGLEDEISSTHKKNYNKKCSMNLNTKFCKSGFNYNTRNSPKKNVSAECQNLYSSPTKKPRITMLSDLRLKPSSPKIANFANEHVLKFRLGETKDKNHEKKCDINMTEQYKFENDNCETIDNAVHSDIEMDPLSLSFKNKKSFIKKEIASPSYKSVKKAATDAERTSPNKHTKSGNSDSYSTPKKKTKFDGFEEFCLTRSGRRVKAVNYTEDKYERSIISATTPTKKLRHFVCRNYSEDSDSDDFTASSYSSDDDDDDDDLLDETSPYKLKRSSKGNTTTKKARKDVRTPISKKKIINLNIPERKTPLREPRNALEESRKRLHVSSVPSSLPCRDEEYSDIYSFVKGCLCAQTGGCMYISGVPGTGKTATVHEVMRNLEEEKESGEVPIFTFVEVNGMWMTDPYQCYVQIFKALNGKCIAPQQAADLLEKRFTEHRPKKDAVVLLVDELDRLWTRKQTVMYNIFDWPTKQNSKLIVLAIANTMDLPERMMMNRISSRLGLTRKTFQPYTFKQLQEIIMSRIQELKVFDPDAVQLVSRKVAAVSGDARRALDICRFATETVKVGQTAKKGQKILVGMEHVDKALQQMFSSPVIAAIRSSSKIAKIFFHCILSEFTRTGLEETTLLKVHQQVVSICRFEGLNPPNTTETSRVCADLATSHLILVDDFKNDLYMKIRLNVSSDDVTYALSLK